MTAGAPSALTYLKLSEWFNQKGQPQQRDRFLVLAADAAQAAGRQEDAEKLRMRLLKHNPHHLLRPYSSFAQALSSADVQSYVNDLRNSYPPKKAAEMLASASSGPNQSAAQPKPLPPTQPVVDLDAEAAKYAGKEPLKVFRAKEDGAPVPKTSTHGYGERARTAMPPARRQDPPLAAPGHTTTARSASPARPTVLPPVYTLAPEQRPQSTAWKEFRRSEGVTESVGAGWVEMGLFALVLSAGVAMSVYALAGPMLLGHR
jgi:hypothetical protein